jgi:hypothetical protein
VPCCLPCAGRWIACSCLCPPHSLPTLLPFGASKQHATLDSASRGVGFSRVKKRPGCGRAGGAESANGVAWPAHPNGLMLPAESLV